MRFFSFADRIEMRHLGWPKASLGAAPKGAFGPQIDEKGCFSGLSPARPYAAAPNFGLRMHFQTTVLSRRTFLEFRPVTHPMGCII
jgi:hypothetical protein